MAGVGATTQITIPIAVAGQEPPDGDGISNWLKDNIWLVFAGLGLIAMTSSSSKGKK